MSVAAENSPRTTYPTIKGHVRKMIIKAKMPMIKMKTRIIATIASAISCIGNIADSYC